MNEENFSTRLKEARERNNMSQADLARLLGRPIQTISNWENQVSLPTLEIFNELCDILHVSGNYLLGKKMNLSLSIEDLSNELAFDLKEIINYIKK